MTLCFAFAGTLCPRLWDEDLVGNKYENVTGEETVTGAWLRRDGLCSHGDALTPFVPQASTSLSASTC